MVRITLLWSAQNKHLHLSELVNSVKTPVQILQTLSVCALKQQIFRFPSIRPLGSIWREIMFEKARQQHTAGGHHKEQA
jgi:hypothetical protein